MGMRVPNGNTGTGVWGRENEYGSMKTRAWGRENGEGSMGWDFRDGSMRIQWDKFTIINCTICGTNISKFKWTICIPQYSVRCLY